MSLLKSIRESSSRSYPRAHLLETLGPTTDVWQLLRFFDSTRRGNSAGDRGGTSIRKQMPIEAKRDRLAWVVYKTNKNECLQPHRD